MANPLEVVGKRGVRCAAAAALLVVLAGCRPNLPPPEPTQSKLGVLARFYGEMVSRNGGQAPANEAAFQAYLNQLPAEPRKAMGLDDLSKAFVSPRDGKPFGVVYGSLPTGGPGLHGQPVVMYERDGKEGKRMVANLMGAVAEVSQEEFQGLVPNRAP